MAAVLREPQEEAGGCGGGPRTRQRPRLGAALRSVRERLCLPAAGMRPQQTGSQAPGLFFVTRGQRVGQGGQQSGTAGSLSRYLFSMFCICKLREVKLASRSVTSSTCGRKPRLCEGVPGSPRTAPQAWRQALSLLPEPVRASPRAMGQLSKGESVLPQREGPRPLPERWTEALRPTEDGNQQPRLSLQPQSRDRLPGGSCQAGVWTAAALTCSRVLVIWRRVQRSSSRSRCSCRPRRSRYSLSIWMI